MTEVLSAIAMELDGFDPAEFDDQFDEDCSPRGGGSGASSFVRKLFEIVSSENDGVVGWMPDGISFEVKDPKRLEAEILPKYFRHSRFQSLVRQLNFYAFKKVSKERSSWIYSHDNFQRNRAELLDGLRRKTSRQDFGVLRKPCSPSVKRPRNIERSDSNGSDSISPSPSTDECDADYSRKRSITVVDDVLHSWENVHKFFSARRDDAFIRPTDIDFDGDVEVDVSALNWDRLAEELSAQGIDSASCAIILFALRRNPWVESKALFFDVFHILTHNSELTSEVNSYSEALSPSAKYGGSLGLFEEYNRPERYLREEKYTSQPAQRYHRSLSLGDNNISPISVNQHIESEDQCINIPVDGILRENESTITRAFMNFAVTRLQMAADRLENQGMRTVLECCRSRWQNYAQVHR